MRCLNKKVHPCDTIAGSVRHVATKDREDLIRLAGITPMRKRDTALRSVVLPFFPVESQ
jgi:hypothetical protein